METTKDGLCMYCGLGCRLKFMVRDGMLVGTLPDPSDPVSMGSPCIRGLTIHEVAYRGRVLRPMIREEKGRPLREATWGEALEAVADEIRSVDPEEVAIAISGRITNEDAFSLIKLALAVIGTSNVDGINRVCHAPTIEALNYIFGLPASTGKLEDLDSLDFLLLAATNPAVDYPAMYSRMARAHSRGMRMAFVGTIASETSRIADASVLVRPGGEATIFNYMSREVMEAGAYPSWVEGLEGFREYSKLVRGYGIERATSVLLSPQSTLRTATELLVSSSNMGVMSGVGLTQREGAMVALHALYDLALLKGATVLTQRGLVNVQGIGDMGASPHVPPPWGERAEGLWGVTLPSDRGLTLGEALTDGRGRVLILSDMNPLHSMPDTKAVERTLERSFVVCMCNYYNETVKLADVVLPTPIMPEREGSVTTGERRVRPVKPVASPPGLTRQEWVIASGIAASLNRGDLMGYSDVWDVTEEIVKLVPGYEDVSVEALKGGEDQWADKSPRGMKFALTIEGDPLVPPPDRPWLLVSIRGPVHFLGGEITWRSKRLARAAEAPSILLNSEDIMDLGLKEGERLTVCSDVGCLEAPAKISPLLPRGFIGYHLHNRRRVYNRLVPLRLERGPKTPAYRYVPVKLLTRNGEVKPRETVM